MKSNKSQKKKAYFMIAPAVVILLLVVAYPLLKSIWYSFFDLKLNDSSVKNFVGFDNYGHYLKSSNSEFWHAMQFTLVFTLLTLLIELILGILIASIMNKKIKGMPSARACLLIPLTMPAMIVALIWKFIFDSQAGFLANFFEKIHIINNSDAIMTTHGGLLFASVFADMWKTMPFIILIFLYAMSRIDKSLYEAAEIEGSGKSFNFFHITIPILKPVILAAVLFKALDAFRTFDIVYVLTGGAKNTETISTLAYKTMFNDMNLGRGAALSVIAFICSVIIGLVFIKIIGVDTLSGKEWENE